MYRSIVVGTDGSEGAAHAVATAAELAGYCGATLHVATVGGAATSAMLGDPLAGAAAMSVGAEETRDELAAIVEKAAEPALAQGVNVATHALVGTRRKPSATWRSGWPPTCSSSGTAACKAAADSSAACPTRCRTTRRAACSSSTPPTSPSTNRRRVRR